MHRFTIVLMSTCLCLILLTANVYAQKIDIAAQFNKERVTVVNRKATLITGDSGHSGIHLDEQPGAGILWLNDTNFSNGTITFEVKGKDVLQRSFVGLAFHGTNDSLYDAVYLRPFNFKAPTQERRNHAVQYVSLPAYDWEILRTQFPDKYEKPVHPVPDPNKWVKVRITVKYPQVSVYINDHPTPSLVVEQLSKQSTGKIGCWVGNNSGGAFANLQITAQ